MDCPERNYPHSPSSQSSSSNRTDSPTKLTIAYCDLLSVDVKFSEIEAIMTEFQSKTRRLPADMKEWPAYVEADHRTHQMRARRRHGRLPPRARLRRATSQAQGKSAGHLQHRGAEGEDIRKVEGDQGRLAIDRVQVCVLQGHEGRPLQRRGDERDCHKDRGLRRHAVVTQLEPVRRTLQKGLPAPSLRSGCRCRRCGSTSSRCSRAATSRSR